MADANETYDLFITGLRNAHAMEKQALSIMRPQLQRIENYPEVARRIEQHIAETEGQIARLDGLLDSRNESNSGLKDMALSFVGGMAALGHTVAPDEILKNSMANYAFENYEIAAYKSLITLADATGHADAVAALQENLREEEAMAGWLEENLPVVTMQYAGLRQAGETAKR